MTRQEQQREAEERQRDHVRKLKQAAFDFSGALAALKGDIEGLLPDYHCAAALFSEMEPQRHANALWEEREWLESYEDKKLVKNCLEMTNAIRASIEKHAATAGIKFDQLASILSSRKSSIGLWRTLSADAHKAIEELSRSLGNWVGTGPADFLDAFEQLRNVTVSTRAAMNMFAQEQSQFRDSLDFVAHHPAICQIWPDASESSPGKAEGMLSKGRTLLSQADQLLGKWTSEVGAFKGLKDLFFRAEYEDFLEKLKKSAPHIAQLQEVTKWADAARARSERVTLLIRSARDQIRSRSWRRALATLREANSVPCSQRRHIELRELELTALKGILPTRIAWVAGIGTISIIVENWFGMPRWLLLESAVAPAILAIMLLVQVIAKGRK
jgi:hypothetical protein